jgi:hypothetical protein
MAFLTFVLIVWAAIKQLVVLCFVVSNWSTIFHQIPENKIWKQMSVSIMARFWGETPGYLPWDFCISPEKWCTSCCLCLNYFKKIANVSTCWASFSSVHWVIPEKMYRETFCHFEGKQKGPTFDNSKILKGIQRGQEVGNLQFLHGKGLEVFWNDPLRSSYTSDVFLAPATQRLCKGLNFIALLARVKWWHEQW